MEPVRFAVTIRSKTTAGTDVVSLDLYPGQVLTEQAETMATGYGATVETINIDRATIAAQILQTMQWHGLRKIRAAMLKGKAELVTFWLECLTASGYLEKVNDEFWITPKFAEHFANRKEV